MLRTTCDAVPTDLQGNLDAIEFLISKGVQLDVLDNYGRSGLWLAASYGLAKVVRMLLRNGLRPLLDVPANAGHVETRGRTPLLTAAMHGHIKVLLTAARFPRGLLQLGPGPGAVEGPACGQGGRGQSK